MRAALLAPSSLELWRKERARRQLSFWWKTLILIGHYGKWFSLGSWSNSKKIKLLALHMSPLHMLFLSGHHALTNKLDSSICKRSPDFASIAKETVCRSFFTGVGTAKAVEVYFCTFLAVGWLQCPFCPRQVESLTDFFCLLSHTKTCLGKKQEDMADCI